MPFALWTFSPLSEWRNDIDKQIRQPPDPEMGQGAFFGKRGVFMSTFITRGTCSKAINFDIEDGKVANVAFQGGCNGNTKGIAALVEGMPVEEVIDKLEGITCGPRKTSCPDQLAKALSECIDS